VIILYFWLFLNEVKAIDINITNIGIIILKPDKALGDWKLEYASYFFRKKSTLRVIGINSKLRSKRIYSIFLNFKTEKECNNKYNIGINTE
jgi:hypothetical protein